MGSTFKCFIFKNFSSVFDNIISDDSALNVLRLIKSNLSEENFSLLISSNVKSFTSYPHIGVESIWRIATQIFGPQQIKILLLINNETNLSFFHMVIRNKRKNLLKTILEEIKKLFSDNEIFSILKLLHKDDLEFMDFAMMHFEKETFKMLADFLIENIIKEENLSQLISQQSVRLCAMEQNQGAMIELLKFLNTIRFGLFREFLLVIDENDRITSFIYYMLHENPAANWTRLDVEESIKSLFFYTRTKVYKHEMKKLKFKRNCQGKMK